MMAAAQGVEPTDPRERVVYLVAAARRLVVPGQARADLVQELLTETGLSRAGIELALTTSLELSPSEAEVRALVASAEPCARVWVVLSGNVFVAEHRALALALATGGEVFVRPSRRGGALARALQGVAPGLFQLVDAIEPRPGDQVHAYGSDETLAQLAATLPGGSLFFGHGHGFGIAWVHTSDDSTLAGLVDDVTLFDQQGCLSPRLVLLEPHIDALQFGQRLAEALCQRAAAVPLGGDEAAPERAWFRDVAHCVAQAVWAAGPGVVALQKEPQAVLLPPGGRNLVLVQCPAPLQRLRELSPSVTTLGVAGPKACYEQARQSFPQARLCALGQMQRPRFDGPVDLRSNLKRVD